MYVKRKFYETEFTSHLLVSMIIEMMLDGNLEVSNKSKVSLTDKIPTVNYTIQLCNAIKEGKFSRTLRSFKTNCI